jgi:hypothetical protein
MSITLDDETQQLFLTLAESLEGGEPLPTKLLVTSLQHPEASIPPSCHRGDSTRERSRSHPSAAASDG